MSHLGAGRGASSTEEPSAGTRRERPWYVTVLRNRRLVIGGVLLLAVAGVAVLAQALATHDPLKVRPEIRPLAAGTRAPVRHRQLRPGPLQPDRPRGPDPR